MYFEFRFKWFENIYGIEWLPRSSFSIRDGRLLVTITYKDDKRRYKHPMRSVQRLINRINFRLSLLFPRNRHFQWKEPITSDHYLEVDKQLRKK